MIRLVNWLGRTWSFDLPVGVFPALLERLRGGPVRAEELVAGVPDTILRARPGGSWSVKEHLGHLDDLHVLDSVSEILRRFRDHRSALLLRREALTEDDLDSKSRHPRLRRAIRLIDWMQFVADHDDHHLARAREALRAMGRNAA